ncbi:tRNA synthetase class II (G H P and S) [Paenibacillus curdlanolyticus YK9]|uniref:tRNA synthetase class II (G H P and S) n=1 Tax=Paenibacillus curdlanolyticus YK9 TaxID=717606 RepID=E0ICY4_9BACL|nr:aminoacyl--tRNA ligase-related protein [Paenibacillus curdlanolyticus]EFM09699.1 tRNA synthetase class II (G H P and S) [Paenibacillus curdlanolyticus YK9]
MNLKLMIPAGFDEQKRGLLIEQVSYVTPAITAVAIDQDDLLITLGEGSEQNEEVFTQQFEAILAKLEDYKSIPIKTIKSNEDSGQAGRQSLSRDHASIDPRAYQMLDDLFLGIARKHQAMERRYPTLLKGKVMHTCGYASNFPQNVYAVAEIPHRFEALESAHEHMDGAFQKADYYLQPCICYHVYEELSGQQVSGVHLYTAEGRCFRHEAEWRLNAFRRNEFSMREIVMVGTSADITEIRQRIIDDVWELFVKLGLNGTVQTANDPFFTTDGLDKLVFQLMSSAKYELIAQCGTISSAISSFNHSGDVIAKKFQITGPDGEAAHSGCVGFGIDRWIQALAHRYGDDLQQWPLTMLEPIHS